MHTLKTVITQLHAHRQRATYGAVAGLLGRPPRSVLQGCPRDWHHSWVVNQDTGEPSAYPAGMVHPALHENAEVLSTPEMLATWLQRMQSQS